MKRKLGNGALRRKLTPQDVALVKRIYIRYHKTRNSLNIARLFDVDPTTITKLLRGETYSKGFR